MAEDYRRGRRSFRNATRSACPTQTAVGRVRHLRRSDAGRHSYRAAQQDLHESTERLLDMEALGWVTRSEFGGTSGWSLTERGRAEGERRLALEVDTAGARTAVAAVHERFLPLNGRFQETVTRWQIRPLPGVPMAANDHTRPYAARPDGLMVSASTPATRCGCNCTRTSSLPWASTAATRHSPTEVDLRGAETRVLLQDIRPAAELAP